MTKRKRGRKRKNGLYFGEEQEKAVVAFLSEKDPVIRNKIYNEHLRDAFNTMVDSIIRRYKLYRKTHSFENVHSDTLSYLILKADKFNPTIGKRAYSYYGTICKHYILGLMIKDTKMLNQTLDFDTSISTIHEDEKFIYHLPETDYTLSDLIDTISEEIRFEIENEGKDNRKKLTDNERKVGEALIDILTNWEMLFSSLQGGSKFNKNVILATIRENTNLVTKEIRVAMRRYKTIYDMVKGDKIDKGYL
tara:strand:+ start:24122 stop:24868 length:747 start_codon:yes stop_codon:yes gene_type:complete